MPGTYPPAFPNRLAHVPPPRAGLWSLHTQRSVTLVPRFTVHAPGVPREQGKTAAAGGA